MTRSQRHRRPVVVGRIVLGCALLVVLIAGVVASLHGPVVPLTLMGDSYQWIQQAHAAAHRPHVLVSDLDAFFRPSTTWTLVVDRGLWGGFDAAGYRVTNLALHMLGAVLLGIAGRRTGAGPFASAMIALMWVTSPFTDESAFLVASRIQSLLIISWLLLMIAWPRADESWTPVRVMVTVAAIIAAAASKETWVVTPGLVAALELDRGRSLRQAAVPAALVGLLAAVYGLWYAATLASPGSYYELGSHMVAKIPQQLAAFLYLREPVPFEPRLSWEGVVATAVVAAIVLLVMRWRRRGVWTALAVLVLPTLPTLALPYMPQRFLSLPYAGFLLLVAVWVGGLQERLPRHRRAISLVVAAVTVLVTVAGAALVRADLADYRAIAAAHTRLLDEARAVAGVVSGGDPVLVVRDERSQPLVEILRDPRGLPKLPFTRHDDPYGLIDAAALFEWVVADEGTRVQHIDDWSSRCAGVAGRVLVHRDGTFERRDPVPDLAVEASRWQAAGRRVRVIRAVSLD